MVTLELPYPPTINTYWRHSRGRHFIASRGLEFRAAVRAEVLGVGVIAIDGPVLFRAEFNPPDRRVRDLDNVIKPLWDALVHAGVMRDDSQVRRMEVEMGGVIKGGRSVVMLEELNHA